MRKHIVVAAVVIAVSLLVAIAVPSRPSRDLTIDYSDPRVRRLQQIEWAISIYHTNHKELPPSLTALLDVAVARGARLRDQLGNGTDIEKEYFYNPSAYASISDVPIVGEVVPDSENHTYVALPKGGDIQIITGVWNPALEKGKRKR